MLPADYAQVLLTLTNRVKDARLRAQRQVNTALVRLYWEIGSTVSARTKSADWGDGVLRQLSQDLRAAFPGVRGLSSTNLSYMRRFAEAYPDPDTADKAIWDLPWTLVIDIVTKLSSDEERTWYARSAVANNWSRSVLNHQISSNGMARLGAAPTNFDTTLLPGDSDRAKELTKDPYVLDFIQLNADAKERDLEDALLDRITDTLRELGDGFAFYARQKRFDVGEDEFIIDLLFFHVTQLRWVVVELKIGKFKPEYAGQLGMYVNLVDDQLRIADLHAPTVGILLVTDRNDQVVRYSLAGAAQPMAVSTYETLPAPVQEALVSPELLQKLEEDVVLELDELTDDDSIDDD
ncbi:PDDEXK nuclease domain-containing protein [Curtobacterium sp. MCBA15_013]|uniref:PDDEXK nuclease domain-containing protein n=1 Tax=Curtobacterium sp. MCBA15_013 TaxID=1898739 RepID=UPI0008DDC7E9|nr:PDDEXK nuclease domain-containing protein [Curtobacterium sp. MCBA15_013]OII21857.1 hypothetical protein BIV01_17700 [Curtobacterium sp. MCBA15_013]